MSTECTTFYVRGMVCSRCIMMVTRLVRGLALTPERVALGEVTVADPASKVDWTLLAEQLTRYGFALLLPPNRQLVIRLGNLVAELLITTPQNVRVGCIGSISKQLGCRSAELRAACQAELGDELGHYLTRRRVQAAQAVLDEKPTATIQSVARALGYSTQAHFCRQFRMITGCSPTAWRRTRGLPDASGPAISTALEASTSTGVTVLQEASPE